MAILYLDTSALVKLYVQERGSENLIALATDAAGHRMAILSLARVEFRSAVRRRQRAGDIDPQVADVLIAALAQQLQDFFVEQSVTEAALDEAQWLIDMHALRAYDAVQLAGARQLDLAGSQDIIFVCSDGQLCAVAERVGLRTYNPETDDAASLSGTT